MVALSSQYSIAAPTMTAQGPKNRRIGGLVDKLRGVGTIMVSTKSDYFPGEKLPRSATIDRLTFVFTG